MGALKDFNLVVDTVTIHATIPSEPSMISVTLETVQDISVVMDSGLPGSQGSQGNQGSQGAKGDQGNQGVPGTGTGEGDGSQGPQGDQGYQGNQGVAGSQGSQGDDGIGENGAEGEQGNQGSQGEEGPQGNQGDQGDQGTQGETGEGSQGNQGSAGSQGNQGDQGETGSGSQGNQGDAGSQGNQGYQGNQGSQGDIGEGTQGNQGDQGIQGEAGEGIGIPGDQGNQGYQGYQGNQGNQGTTGEGNQGDQGDQGTQGNQGDSGDQGTQGNQGVAGSGSQGNQGDQGHQGDTGEGSQGNQGDQGDQGTQGNQGDVGEGTQGNQGNQGVQGAASTVEGPQGNQGSQGNQGDIVDDHGSLTGLIDNDHPQYQLRCGVSDRTATLSYADGVFTATHVTDYDVWTNGVKWTITDDRQVNIANNNTLHYVYFDTDGTMKVATGAWDITGNAAPFALVYRVSSSLAAIGDERHIPDRNRALHAMMHDTIGTRYDTLRGGLVGTFGATTFSISDGYIWDEDLEHHINGTQTTCRRWSMVSGGASMTFVDGCTTLYTLSGSDIQWDNSPLEVADNNKYVCHYVYATNDIDVPIYCLVGQAHHGTITLARNEVPPVFAGLSTVEWRLLYRVIYQNTGNPPTYKETADYRNVSGVPVSFTPTAHASLTGLQADDHPQYLLVADVAEPIPGPQGYQGNQGNQGTASTVEGPQGDQGNQGETGSGSQGNQGYQGETGEGNQGDQGSQGTQGNQGDAGEGSQGDQGNQGDQGSQGNQGNQGDEGNQGNQGDQGAGSQGDQGNQGNQGNQGTTTGTSTTSATGVIELATQAEVLAGTDTSRAVVPVDLWAKTAIDVNPKAFSQGVNMTYAASGSSGITVADNANIDFGTGNFTLTRRLSLPAWTPTVATLIIYKVGGGAPYEGYGVQITTGGVITFLMYRSGVGAYTANCSSAISAVDGSEHEITISVTRETAGSAGSVIFYFDGVQLGNSVSITAAATVTIDTTEVMYISGSSAERFPSVNKSALTFNYALSSSQILSLYQNGISDADKCGSQTAISSDTAWTGASGATPPTNWNVSAAATYSIFDSGDGSPYNACLKIAHNGTNNNPASYRQYTVTQGKRYKFSIYFKHGTATNGQIILYDGTNFKRWDSLTNASWTKYEHEFVASTTYFRCYIYAQTSTSGQYELYDEAFVYEIGATLALEPEGIQSDKWYDSSTNYLNATYPTAGWNLIRKTNESLSLSMSLAEHNSSGIKVLLTAGASLAYGDPCKLNASGKAIVATADAIANAGAEFLCLESSISADSTGYFLIGPGILRHDAFSLTAGSRIYLSTTGTITHTAPSSSNNVVQVLGVALSATKILFRPELTMVEVS